MPHDPPTTVEPAAVTVLMPLKNHHPEFLRLAIESLFRQSCPAWRLSIVVERRDHARLRRRLAAPLEDPHLELRVNEGRKLSGAFNTGMRHASTAFVAILLADDLWSPNAVEVLRDAILRFPEVDFFHSARAIIDERGERVSSVHPSRTAFALEEFQRTSPVKHLLCWRREKALAIGGMDETLNSVGPDDWDFPWSMAEHGARFHALAECLYEYRDHRETYRLTTHLPLSVHLAEIERILRKHGVDGESVAHRLEASRATYLRQCLYASPLDKLWKEIRGHDPRRGWRDAYR